VKVDPLFPLTKNVLEKPPALEVRLYEVMAAPPSDAALINVIRALRLPVATATTEDGALGDLTDETRFDASDGKELPTELVAITVKV
jgi:hypothetical protein